MATFNDTETEAVREIIQISTAADDMAILAERLSALNDAQAAATRADITAFSRIAYGTVMSRGGIKGTDFSVDRDRLHITNRVRLRLQYPTIAGDIDAKEMGIAVVRGVPWIGC